MAKLDTMRGVLNFAISNEDKSFKHYISLAERATNSVAKQLLNEMAMEELKHKELLMEVREGERDFSNSPPPKDSKLMEILESVDHYENVSFREALIVAERSEARARYLYLKLAEEAKSTELKKLFTQLAKEENNHKDKFEVLCDQLEKI